MWEFSWELFFYLCLTMLAITLFFKQIAARELANQAAIRLCRQQHVAFLDGTVSFQKLWPRLTKQGHLRMQRYYSFDYLPPDIETIETARKTGFIVLLGNQIESIGFAPENMN